MTNILKWINDHSFEAHLTAFALMILPSIALYFSAQQGNWIASRIFIGLVVSGNLLLLLVKKG